MTKQVEPVRKSPPADPLRSIVMDDNTECLEHKPVIFFFVCPFEKTHLKTRKSVQGNGGFQIHMQFSLSESNVATYQIGVPVRESLSIS